jgi:hypothetical protein
MLSLPEIEAMAATCFVSDNERISVTRFLADPLQTLQPSSRRAEHIAEWSCSGYNHHSH